MNPKLRKSSTEKQSYIDNFNFRSKTTETYAHDSNLDVISKR